MHRLLHRQHPPETSLWRLRIQPDQQHTSRIRLDSGLRQYISQWYSRPLPAPHRPQPPLCPGRRLAVQLLEHGTVIARTLEVRNDRPRRHPPNIVVAQLTRPRHPVSLYAQPPARHIHVHAFRVVSYKEISIRSRNPLDVLQPRLKAAIVPYKWPRIFEPRPSLIRLNRSARRRSRLRRCRWNRCWHDPTCRQRSNPTPRRSQL